MLFWMGLAWARKVDLGDPDADRCDPAALAALDATDAATVAGGVLDACPGLPEVLRGWLVAHRDGLPSEAAREVCTKARGDLSRGLSPGFEARMVGVAKTCRLKRFDAAASTGPDALLLGSLMADRLDAAGQAAIADRVGGLLAGIVGGRPAGRYGSFAALVDAIELPLVERTTSPLPDGEVYGLDGSRRAGTGPVVVLVARDATGDGLADLIGQVASADGGCWVAAHPRAGELEPTHEHAPLVGVQVFAGTRPAGVRLVVSPTGMKLSLGDAGPEAEGPIGELVERARTALALAQEFGGSEAPPERVWIQPVDGATAQQVLSAIDGLLDEDGSPRFAEVVVAREGALVEWPERLDGAGW